MARVNNNAKGNKARHKPTSKPSTKVVRTAPKANKHTPTNIASNRTKARKPNAKKSASANKTVHSNNKANKPATNESRQKKKATRASKSTVVEPNANIETKTEQAVTGDNFITKLKKIIPNGRTLNTKDKYLPHTNELKEPEKNRWVTVVASNDKDELAVVALSSKNGKNRVKLGSNSYAKTYVEIEDDIGAPIKVGAKFKENHKNNDINHDKMLDIQKSIRKGKYANENKKKLEKLQK